MQKRKQSRIPLLLLMLGISLGVCACVGSTSGSDSMKEVEQAVMATAIPIETQPPTAAPTATPIPTPTPFPEYDINLMMVGDNLMHMGIVYTGLMEDGSYNYDFLFEGITPFLEEAEIKIINQETILGGNELGFSGYPHFNSPTEVGDAIAKAGFNVVLHSSNHTADKKLQGILNCVEFWKQYPQVTVAGIYGEEDTDEIPIITIEDVRFAVLNYAYAPNTETFSSTYEDHMDILCAYDENTRKINFTKLHEEVLTDIRFTKKLSV